MPDPLLPVISLAEVAGGLAELWSPRIVAELNGQAVKVARLQGEFVWHDHRDEDEFFLVLRGRLRLDFETGSVTLEAGQSCVVPRGVRHRPVAAEECWVLLFEPLSTAHTGDVVTPFTRSLADQRGGGPGR